MKKLWMVFLLGFMVFIRAEKVLYLDEKILNQEIKKIMRAHGIEPDAQLIDETYKRFHKLCGTLCPVFRSLRHFTTQKTNKNDGSIADLYLNGFQSLTEGNLGEAMEAWSIVALSYPILDEQRHMVWTAINFLGQIQDQPFPVLKINSQKVSGPTNIILLPLAPSILLSAFFLG